MTAPTDRVQLLKQESAALGGTDPVSDAVPFVLPLNPQQDAPEVMGIYLQDAVNRDGLVYITRTGNNMIFRDVATGIESTLTQLLGGAASTDLGWRRHFLMMGG